MTDTPASSDRTTVRATTGATLHCRTEQSVSSRIRTHRIACSGENGRPGRKTGSECRTYLLLMSATLLVSPRCYVRVPDQEPGTISAAGGTFLVILR
jgi:hypothetical protein